MHPRNLSVVLLAAVATAQTGDKSEGPLMVIAHGLSVDAATVLPGGNAGTVVIPKSDFKPTPPPAWTPPMPGFPDLTLLPWVGIAGVDIDGLSLGLDYILADAVGHIAVPAGQWGAITFSVSRATAGALGGLIHREVLRPGGAAADVFGYILPGSVGFPASWIDVPLRGQDSTEISLDAPGAPGNIDALDVYMGVFFGDATDLAPLIPGFPAVTVFFSVTTASVSLLPAAWWGTAPASGATVLATTWNASTLSWSVPVAVLTPAALGLSPAEDVDALAIDVIRGRVLISTTRMVAYPRDPILFVDLSTPGTNYVYRRADDVPVSTRLGLLPGGIDDIDGICALDPGLGNQFRADRLFCAPQQPVYPAPGNLGVSVHRELAPSGPQVVSYMTGFPTPTNPQPGIAVAAVSLGGTAGPWFSLAAFFRPLPTSPYFLFQGHPERIAIPIPSSPNLVGVPLVFLWGAFDSTGLDVSLPVGLVL